MQGESGNVQARVANNWGPKADHNRTLASTVMRV